MCALKLVFKTNFFTSTSVSEQKSFYSWLVTASGCAKARDTPSRDCSYQAHRDGDILPCVLLTVFCLYFSLFFPFIFNFLWRLTHARLKDP